MAMFFDIYEVVLASISAIFVIGRLALSSNPLVWLFIFNRFPQCSCLLLESALNHEPFSAERI